MSRFEIRFTPPARRAIEFGLPEKVAVAAVEFIYGQLAGNPRRVGKQLRDELAGQWSARRGDYRVLYTIHNDTVVVNVLRIDHRRDVYRPG